jgi:hypothetical protein
MTSFEDILSTVDWTRMAVPQSDGYDTRMTLLLATHGRSPLRPAPYRRRSVDGEVAFCDGEVAIRAASGGGPFSRNIIPAPPNHPHLPIGATLLARWPAAYAQFKQLIDTVYPYSDVSQAKLGPLAFGSSSHAFEHDFGSVLVTVDDPLGLAQALIHEMAHQKLRALGVSLEVADRLITNPPDQQFDSPIRKDRTRPMTAVFHAQHSFIYVTALDLYMLDAEADEEQRDRILMLLARNVPRMQAGYDEVARNITTDAAGGLFMESFMRWSLDVLERGQAALDASGYAST